MIPFINASFCRQTKVKFSICLKIYAPVECDLENDFTIKYISPQKPSRVNLLNETVYIFLYEF